MSVFTTKQVMPVKSGGVELDLVATRDIDTLTVDVEAVGGTNNVPRGTVKVRGKVFRGHVDLVPNHSGQAIRSVSVVANLAEDQTNEQLRAEGPTYGEWTPLHKV